MWFTDHGRDWMGDDGPKTSSTGCQDRRATSASRTAMPTASLDADIKKAERVRRRTLPVATMGPHAAAMGVKFYTGKMFPAEYHNTMFIARKGSWNR